MTFSLADPDVRRTVVFLAVATIVNLGIVSFASFGAVLLTRDPRF